MIFQSNIDLPNMGQPHIVAIPFPAQGHVKPLMKLSLLLASRGIKVTFVNTESIHSLIMATTPPELADELNQIRYVSLPDGLRPEDDGNGVELMDSMTMSGHLTDLIKEINQSADEDPVTCIIADVSVHWALQVAKQVGVLGLPFCPAGPGTLALNSQLPRLIEEGILGTDGSLIGRNSITLSDDIPAWSNEEFPWSMPSNPTVQNACLDLCHKTNQVIRNYDQILCNTFYELDQTSCDTIPKILPVFSSSPSNNSRSSIGNFWHEDSSCMDWLDKQPVGSVIYIAFGSIAFLGPQQVEELAHALETVACPFLWVSRSDFTQGPSSPFPNGFIERVADKGKLVKWASQEKVLAHPAVACFISHCGWNSTIEGLSSGVPFLCWPYFFDQFHNRNYICDVWKIGLGLDRAEDGMITRHEITRKIMLLLRSEGIKENAVRLMEKGRESSFEGGSSYKNLETLVRMIQKLSP